MPFVEHDDMVQEFSAKRADYTLHVGILPGRRLCGHNLMDTERVYSSSGSFAVNAVAVSH